MIQKGKVSSTLLYGSLMAFILFVAYILHFNQEVFYTAYDRSEFLYGSSFFHILFSRPFSLIEYIGSWLTQLFYYPALGSVVLLVIWTFIFFAGINAFKLHGTAKALMMLPVSCLLSSVVDLGYWIYISPVRGYWFSQSIAYLIIMLLLWIARNTPRKCHLLWYVFAILLVSYTWLVRYTFRTMPNFYRKA